jgi:hypothetical protein
LDMDLPEGSRTQLIDLNVATSGKDAQ